MIYLKLEDQKLGISIVLKCNEKIEQKVVIAHVDDADFWTSRENSERKMQKIVSYCMKMHEATGGKVQKAKVFVHYWKWKDNKITNVNVEIKLKEEVIKKIWWMLALKR